MKQRIKNKLIIDGVEITKPVSVLYKRVKPSEDNPNGIYKWNGKLHKVKRT